MSYQERRAIVSMISTLLITAVYFAIVLQNYPDTGDYSQEVFHYWGSTILVLIPVSIVAKIVIYIVFTIINTIATHEGEPGFEDERDKLIELKANQISMYVFAFGFILAMVSLVMDQAPSVMFSIMILGGLLADMVSDFSQFLFYRRGF